MKLITLFKKLREYRKDRKEYYIERKVAFESDDYYYVFSILPTIIVQPWITRHPGVYVIDITWLHMHIGIGIWRIKDE